MALPLPRVVADVGPGGGVVTAMRGQNALAQDLIDTAIKGSQADYAPWTNYANAASKLAYSQFIGPQAIASILSNPATRGMFTPSQYNALASAFARQVNNPAMSLSAMPVPFGRSNSLLGDIVNKIKSIGNDSPSQNALSIPASVSNAPQSDQNRYMYDQAGNDVMASPDEVSNVANYGNNALAPQSANVSDSYQENIPMNALSGNVSNYGTSPTYQRLQNQVVPQGAYGAINPPSVVQAGEAGIKSQISQEAKNIADQWKARQDDIQLSSKAATGALYNINRMKNAYEDLSKFWETGPLLGRLPAYSGAAQDFDLAANDLMINKLKSWQSKQVTNIDLQLAPTMKPGRYMDNKEFQRAANYEQALHSRENEIPAFSLAAQNMGLSPAQADAIWVRYANESPFYDYKNNKILDKNLQSWENYLTPDSIRQTFSPSFAKRMDQYQSNMYGANPEKDKQIENKFVDRINSPGPAVRLLAHHMDLPNFKSREEFVDWFKRQPAVTKQAVLLHLKEKGEK